MQPMLDSEPTKFAPAWRFTRQTAMATRPMRVAYLIFGTGLGGGELLLVNHLAHCDRERFQPLVICSAEGALAARLRGLNIPVFLLPLNKEASVLGRLSVPQPRTLLQLTRILRQERVDLIHSYTLETRNYAHAAALVTGLPLIHTSQDTWFGDLFGRLQWLALNHIPATIIVTSETVRRSLRVGTLLRADHVVTIKPGVDLDRFAPRDDAARTRSDLGIRASANVVGIIARLSSVKGYETFFAAAARVAASLPDTQFVVVGDAVLADDDYARHIHSDIERHELRNRVIMTGFREDTPQLIAAMDVLVSASPRESFGLVLAEAAACARPVVASCSGGAEEIVVPGITGLLVPAHNPPAMADAILRILADPAAAVAMGAAARRHAESHFDLRRMVRAIEAEYIAAAGAASTN